MKNFIVIFLSLWMFSPAISFSLNWFKFYQKPRLNDELNTLQMIKKDGYPAEAHAVLTEDGYILTMHRIPGKPGSPPILLQHGVLGSSADWIILGREKSLAYLLADRGYDVWFGNFRGNTYSRAHISLTTSDVKFWEFSWHESGVHDLPAMITYIVQVKQSLLKAYIGFSMGTTSFYVMSSERPHIVRLVQSMYSLAPVGFMKHVQTPLRYLAPFATDYKMMYYLFGEGEFLPQSAVLKFLEKYLCYVDILEEKICANSMFVIVGFDRAQFNYTLLPAILNHTPAGTSSRTMIHFAQEIQSGYFRKYDYGKEKNLEIYNSTEPPKYDLSKLTMPIVLFSAENDWLSSPIDVMRLNAELPITPTIFKVPFKKFNHIDYLWAKDAPKLIYDKILTTLNETVL